MYANKRDSYYRHVVNNLFASAASVAMFTKRHKPADRQGLPRANDWMPIPAIILTGICCFLLGTRYAAVPRHSIGPEQSRVEVARVSAQPSPREVGHVVTASANEDVDFEKLYGPGDEALKALLKRIAINGEVIAAVSNSALMSSDGKSGMLKTWIDSLQVRCFVATDL